jgi:hypothetical protein
VRYQQIPLEEFEKRAGREMTVMYRWFQEVGYKFDIWVLRQELPNLTNFERCSILAGRPKRHEARTLNPDRLE